MRPSLASRRYSGSYYMAGYAVECAIKVCIAKHFGRYVVPSKNLVASIYEHELEKLISSAKLDSALKTATTGNDVLRTNWNVAKNWKVDLRYATARSRPEARDMLSAVADPNDGVLQWIRRFW